MKLSVVIPVYNGAATVPTLVAGLIDELATLYTLEIVLVNDASPADDSAQVCERLARHDPRIHFLDLARNFGQENATMAGFNACTGDVVVTLDDDLQNPPSEVVKLVDKLLEGYDVVYSCFARKHHPPLRNLGRRFNGYVASLVWGKPRGLYLSSFRAVTRFVVDELVKYTGPYPYVDGLILRFTRNYAAVVVEHRPRPVGHSGYNLRKLLAVWLNMFTNFSVLPLRIASVLGMVFAVLGLGGACFFVVDRLRHPEAPLGWASLIVSLFILSGVQLFAIGMVGEYLGRLFLKDNGNPQFVVRRSIRAAPPAAETRSTR